MLRRPESGMRQESQESSGTGLRNPRESLSSLCVSVVFSRAMTEIASGR